MRLFVLCGSPAPPRIDRGRLRSEYVIKEGDELVLPCPATGSPVPRLSFVRSEIEADTKRTIERQLGEPAGETSTDHDSIARRTVVSQVSVETILTWMG